LLSLGRAVALAVRRCVEGDALVVAGYLAFTAIFALFPFLIFLLAVAGFIGQTAAAQALIELAFELTPPEVVATLEPAVRQIRDGATPGLLTLGFAAALWVASSGLEGMRHALDRAYGVPERPRHFLVARLLSIGYTVLVAVAILLVLVALVGGGYIKDAIEWLIQRRLLERETYTALRYGFGVSLLLAIVMFVHLALPAARPRPHEVLPGVVLTVTAWAGAATLYSVYLRYLGSYNLTYGSLGGIVLTLFFFYVVAVIFIFGALLNGALREQRLGAPDRLRRDPSS
jgi:membrane protein